MKFSMSTAIIIGLYILFLVYMAWQSARFDKRLRADMDAVLQRLYGKRIEGVE